MPNSIARCELHQVMSLAGLMPLCNLTQIPQHDATRPLDATSQIHATSRRDTHLTATQTKPNQLQPTAPN